MYSNTNVIKLLKTFPLYLNSSNEKHVLVFRRLLERAMKYGYWNGEMADLS